MEEIIQLKKQIPELFRLMGEADKISKDRQDLGIFRFGGLWARMAKEVGNEETTNFFFATLGLGIFIEKNKLYKKIKIKKEKKKINSMFG